MFKCSLLQVILLQVPLEIAWTATVSWMADDVTCRIMVFFRIVGFYLSGFIMIVISLDRLSAIMFPISHRSNTKRTKIMLIMAWVMAPLCALPQCFIFQLKNHPLKLDYSQCTTIGYFESETMVRLLFCKLRLFFICFFFLRSLFTLCLCSP
jgi:gonadotropin-releasing hormone receptor